MINTELKTLEEFNQDNVKKILSEKKIPEFFPGDVVKVGVRITEGKKERIQYFEGVCIAKKSRDLNSSFTVRKISFGEGVDRTFPLLSFSSLSYVCSPNGTNKGGVCNMYGLESYEMGVKIKSSELFFEDLEARVNQINLRLDEINEKTSEVNRTNYKDYIDEEIKQIEKIAKQPKKNQ